jgi:hypothetical protein
VNVEIFRVVNVLIGTRSNRVDDSWLKIEKDGARNVTGVVRLVKEDIFAITAFAGEILEVSILVDAMFFT